MTGIKRALFENADNIVPTESLMEQWFKEFNQEFFNNELPMIKLKVGNCGILMLGCFKSRREVNKRTRRWTSPFNPDTCSITLSNLYEAPEYSLKNIMIHEMVHYWIFYHYDYDPTRTHGWEFLHEARKINEKSSWNITPYSDTTDENVTAFALQKYKSRITDEYIICIFRYYNNYGTYHAIRTDNKYMEAVSNLFERWKCEDVKWYKMKADNPKFGITECINRGRTSLTFIKSGYKPEDVFDKINEEYGPCEYEEFIPEINTDKPLYLAVLRKNNSLCYYACKIEDAKQYDKIMPKYIQQFEMSLYKVEQYNDAFRIALPSKSSFKYIYINYNYDKFCERIKEQYDIDLNKIEKIR